MLRNEDITEDIAERMFRYYNVPLCDNCNREHTDAYSCKEILEMERADMNDLDD